MSESTSCITGVIMSNDLVNCSVILNIMSGLEDLQKTFCEHSFE